MAELGFRTINEMVGRADMLQTDDAVKHWKADGIDLAPILALAKKPREDVEVYCTIKQDHGLDTVLDRQLIKDCQPAIQDGEKVELNIKVQNIDRALCTMLSHEVSKKWGPKGLPEDTIHIRATGSAGQSVGAWMANGVTFELSGDANDFVGKGLSGGRVIIYPPAESTFAPEENFIIGNVALYGAVQGEAFFRGMAAERFGIRNSGARAVVEGVGDHGCEYMTGGRVVVLGQTGRNFAAGMSGGIAYIYDPQDEFLQNCNMEMVELERMEEEADIAELKELIQKHEIHTGSTVAAKILEDWEVSVTQFRKVMPIDYKRALEEMAREDEEEAVTAAGQN
jgi:glutamate synthase (NADPH) large chain